MDIKPIPGNAIHLWPDGGWCYHDDIEEYEWMSDDYEVVLPDDPRWDDIVGLTQESA